MIGRLIILIQIALRNLRASPINLVIGGLIFAGTFLFILLGTLLDNLNTSMAKSVIGSLAGHVQIYSSASKDQLSLYGGMGGDPDLSAVTEFPKIKEAIEKLDNVKTVVPMGVSGALVTSGNIVDVTLEKLRNAYKAKEAGEANAAERIASEKAHVRQIIKVLQGDAERAAKDLMDESALDPETKVTLAKVSSDEFWNDFEKDPYNSLEFLENKVAPQVTDAQLLFLRYVGTDLDTFQKSFELMQIKKGERVPEGRRGFLIADYIYEEQLKLKNARRFDRMKEAMVAGRTIAEDDELKRFVRENKTQTKDIVLQLDGLKTQKMTETLKGYLKSDSTDLSNLLAAFFDTDDQNFNERYDYFYKTIAPEIELYRVRIGDTLTIKAFTRAGYVQSVNVKVYGTFAFSGIEKSPLAGNVSLMDLMSFRDLYGYLTVDKAKEIKELQAATGAKVVSRENAEEELFGEGAQVVAEATAGVIDTDQQMSGVGKLLRQEDLIRRVYTQDEINSGVILNAAVILKDGTKTDEAIAAINKMSDEQKLGIKAISWQQSAGFLGMMIGAFRGLLVVAVMIIFLIAMIVTFSAMLMATIQRTQSIGTLRAIGAQRDFVRNMVLIEAVCLGVVFGGAGALVATGIVGLLGAKGIGAPNDIAYFFFSGPRLYPSLTAGNVIIGEVLVLFVTIVSTLYPSILATRISPLRAMQTDE